MVPRPRSDPQNKGRVTFTPGEESDFSETLCFVFLLFFFFKNTQKKKAHKKHTQENLDLSYNFVIFGCFKKTYFTNLNIAVDDTIYLKGVNIF